MELGIYEEVDNSNLLGFKNLRGLGLRSFKNLVSLSQTKFKILMMIKQLHDLHQKKYT